jgi:Cu2+-exporting ATPase
MDHEHHHKTKDRAARRRVERTVEHLEEKTLHGHNKAASATTQAHPPHHDHGAHGHDHHRMMIDDFKKRFWVSLALSIPVIIISPMIQDILGYSLDIPYNRYVSFGLSSIIYFYGGWPFLTGLAEEVKKASPGMMTLIGVAITVAYLYSSAVAFGLEGMDFFWELATLIVVMLLGHWIEMKSVLGASKALELLVSIMPAQAQIIKNGQTITVKAEDLQSGDIVLIKPGEKVPADGEVVQGESYLNESMLTGESKPVQKKKEDTVIGGSINGNGSLQVRVVSTGKDSYLNKVINLVQEAQKTKSDTQRLADKAAK